MSCNDNSPCVDPCSSNPCDDPCTNCSDTNPAYQCGCLVDSTFECTTGPGDLPNIPINNNMNGKQVLAAIDAKIGQMQEAIEIGGTGGNAGLDVKVKVDALDATAGFLNDKLADGVFVKRSVVNPSGTERVRFDIDPADLISSDADNELTLGEDGKIKCAPAGEPIVHVVDGLGTKANGTGTTDNPISIDLDGVVKVDRECFDGEWYTITTGGSANGNVSLVNSTVKYRVRFDGSIEFKGNATYSVSFGAYSTGERKQTAAFGVFGGNCFTTGELSGINDLKAINYIDAPQTSADVFTQQYGYIIRKNNNNITIEFQSSFVNTTTKSIVVNFDGAIVHPNI